MKQHADAVRLAIQIVWEYAEWGPEHVEAMMETYDATGDEPPCTGCELLELAEQAEGLKRQGMTFARAEAEMLKNLKGGRKSRKAR